MISAENAKIEQAAAILHAAIEGLERPAPGIGFRGGVWWDLVLQPAMYFPGAFAWSGTALCPSLAQEAAATAHAPWRGCAMSNSFAIAGPTNPKPQA